MDNGRFTYLRYMYDYDGNGVLDQNDFECLAVRNTILEGLNDLIILFSIVSIDIQEKAPGMKLNTKRTSRS